MGSMGGGVRGFQPDLGELRLIWLTDSHNITTPTAIRDGGVSAALADANTWRADAVIHTGDIGDNQPENVAQAFALLRYTAINCPLITVIGNHDEYESVLGTPNTATIEGASYFNRSSPFYHTGLLTSANGSLRCRWLTVDNNIYSERADDPTWVYPAHTPGQRCGFNASEPVPGGSYRQFGATQLAWIASTLAADTTSDMIMMLLHYPPATSNPTDIKALADVLQTDGRPVMSMCGHVHPNGTIYQFSTTDGRRTYSSYKMPATMESGAYCRIRVRVGGRNSHLPLVAEMSVCNFTNPGGWTLSTPFVLAS